MTREHRIRTIYSGQGWLLKVMSAHSLLIFENI
jgi:hypothetical protein